MAKKGEHHSVEFRQKMLGNKRCVGRKMSEETRKKIGAANFGKKRSDETKRKQSLARLGKKRSEEDKQIMRISKLGNKNPMFGKKASDETKRKQSLARLGKKRSEETKQKMRLKRLQQVFPFKDTSIEIKMQDELSSRGFGYYKHYPIIGQPDIAFPDKKIVIFCDGDFYHGNPNKYKSDDKQIHGKTMGSIWEKDKRITDTLQQKGWRVLRYWEHEINQNIIAVVDEIEDTLIRKTENIIEVEIC